MTRDQQIKSLEHDWAQNPRWNDVQRGYSAADVVRLRGSVQPEYTLAQRGAEREKTIATADLRPSPALTLWIEATWPSSFRLVLSRC